MIGMAFTRNLHFDLEIALIKMIQVVYFFIRYVRHAFYAIKHRK